MTTVSMALLLAACGAQQEQAPPPTSQDTTNPAKNTVFREMVEAQDKARAVEDTVAQQRRQMDQALEQAEGKTPEPAEER